MPTTSRLALPSPANTDAVAVPADILALAQALDPIAVTFDAGTLASRPAAGTSGRLWYATNTGVLSWDTGAAWIDVNPSGVVDGAANVGTLRTLGAAALQAAAGNDARLSDQRVPTDASVTAAKVAAALKPSAGAGGSTEALRALGTAAGTAAAGSHKAQHQFGGADQLAVDPRMMTAAPWASLRGSVSVGSSLPVAYCPWNGTNLQQAAAFYAGGTPTRLTIPAGFGGIYSVLATAFWPDPVPSFSSPTVSLFLNGTTLYWDRWVGPALTAAPLQQVPAILLLAAGDYLEVGLTQSGSSSLVVPCRLDAVRVGS